MPDFQRLTKLIVKHALANRLAETSTAPGAEIVEHR